LDAKFPEAKNLLTELADIEKAGKGIQFLYYDPSQGKIFTKSNHLTCEKIYIYFPLFFFLVSLQVISQEIADLQKGLLAMEKELEYHESGNPEDKFHDVISVSTSFPIIKYPFFSYVIILFSFSN